LKVEFKSSFARDLRKLRNDDVRRKVQQVIELVEQSPTLDAVPGVKKLQSSGEYYLLRMGDYRIGITFSGDTVSFVRFLHRRDIYRYFP
jgi:mRNA interferase RelE/StbE